jgi:dTDP-4-amino-4,6-dideoxygalactose transaminase
MSSGGLALLGGEPAYRLPAPRYPVFGDELAARVGLFLREGTLLGLSKAHPVVREFEEAFAAYHGVPHCLGTISGHGALHSALIGLEITGGDHVLTSPYSWGASVSCILHNNAVPVFADVNPVTGLLDAARLADYLTDQTTAILVPHIFGQPADMTAIMTFADQRGLAVIEDGSQAHGATHQGTRVGAFGHAAGFSINGVKPIATAEGGYMLARRDDVYWKATVSGQHAGRGELLGRAAEPGFPPGLRPAIDSLTYTYRPNAVSAMMALDRLGHLDAENQGRQANAADFRRLVDGVRSISFPEYRAADSCVFHMLTINFRAEHAGVARDTYLRALQAEGVPAVAYVERALNASPRLAADWKGPRVSWTRLMAESGTTPRSAYLPGCTTKVASSIEIPWNFVEPDPPRMSALADAFIKLEERLDDLRRFERSTGADDRASRPSRTTTLRPSAVP